MSARIIPEPRLPNPKRQFIPSEDHGPFLMKYTFEHAELSGDTGFSERGEDRRHDEKIWSRIDDAGCPNDRSLVLRRCVTTIRSVLLIIALLAALPVLARAQSLTDSDISSGAVASTTPAQLDVTYTRPTQATKLHNYFFDAFGPYPIIGAAAVAGINQADNAPPEWKQGAESYGKRFGSAYAVGAVGTTTRYALAEAFKEDTLYYRCECTGLFPRLKHAVISTLTARRGEDGHRVFSVPALVAPYVGATTAVYGWYPGRYGAQDALRVGNYSLLVYAGQNIALEFFYSGPHSLLSRMHLNNTHGAPDQGPNR
ncbi:MAG: hypothetical protein ABSD96_14090 [Candidatus Korobacteraceae bacterium]